MTRVLQRFCCDSASQSNRAAALGFSRFLVLCLLPSVVLSLSGCGGSGRVPVAGVVTVDGQPLPDANIHFFPEENTKGPSVGGKIQDGQFKISSDQGLQPGKYRVEITATKASGRKVFIDSINKTVDARSQYLPTRYNEQSELTAVIKADSQEPLEYALKLP